MSNEPDSPGWYAFEGSEWEQIRVNCLKEESVSDYFDENDNRVYFKYENVLGEKFHDVVEVRYSKSGDTVNQKYNSDGYRYSSGPYDGKPILGYILSQHWSRSIHSFNHRVGTWTRLELPWKD